MGNFNSYLSIYYIYVHEHLVFCWSNLLQKSLYPSDIFTFFAYPVSDECKNTILLTAMHFTSRNLKHFLHSMGDDAENQKVFLIHLRQGICLSQISGNNLEWKIPPCVKSFCLCLPEWHRSEKENPSPAFNSQPWRTVLVFHM